MNSLHLLLPGPLVSPSIPLALLLGVDQASPEAAFFGRIAGAALLALGVACWLGWNDRDSPVQWGLLLGVLIYDLAATGILAYTGWILSLVGIALWPAVVLHAVLAVWCVVCIVAAWVPRPAAQRGKRSSPRPTPNRSARRVDWG
jgi:hypothetical protein